MRLHTPPKNGALCIFASTIVLFGGMGENFEIFHRAQSRQTFARGSIRAAQWILNQSKGVYDMQDVLELK